MSHHAVVTVIDIWPVNAPARKTRIAVPTVILNSSATGRRQAPKNVNHAREVVHAPDRHSAVRDGFAEIENAGVHIKEHVRIEVDVKVVGNKDDDSSSKTCLSSKIRLSSSLTSGDRAVSYRSDRCEMAGGSTVWNYELISQSVRRRKT
jgi:hypothetical protein